MNECIKVNNDDKESILIYIDKNKINHKLLNQYINDLEDLSVKYSLISVKK